MIVVWCILFILCGILLSFMAVEDFKTNEVSGIKCLLMWTLIVAGVVNSCILHQWRNVHIQVLIVFVLCLVFYMPIDIPIFGDADFIPLALNMALLFDINQTEYIAIACLSCLLCIPVYIYIYSRVTGIKWKFGAHIMMPAIPIFAMGWWVTGLSLFCIFRFGGTL